MADEIKIETGIPIPKQKGTSKYPFQSMKIGDSFFVPNIHVSALSGSMINARNSMNAPKAKWITRTVTENGVKGVRVWRIA